MPLKNQVNTSGRKGLIGVIGGSGFYKLLEDAELKIIETPFGPSPPLSIGYIGEVEVVFLPRHAKPSDDKISHSIPPHAINYKANIFSLHKLNVQRIIATHSCGSMKKIIKPGRLVLPDQFIDMTKRRDSSFFNGDGYWKPDLKTTVDALHVDVTKPFCPELNQIIYSVCGEFGAKPLLRGVYVCTEGPRFETPAEIKFFKMIGGDIVGMTLIPELVLARELGICYSSISLVSNYAAGVSEEKVTFKEVITGFEKNRDLLFKILKKAITRIPVEKSCGCGSNLKEC
ncbi:MAG: MTAP family purine nucleoside phosphorylase [Candidatus Odinarchaeota archaeon]